MRPSDLPSAHLRRDAPADPLEALWPPIDVRIGRASTGGNDVLYRRLLRMFCRGQRDAVGQFTAALQADDLKAAVRVMHNLRTIAASLGMPELAQASRALELACADAPGEAMVLDPLIAAVSRDLTHVLDGLDTISLD